MARPLPPVREAQHLTGIRDMRLFASSRAALLVLIAALTATCASAQTDGAAGRIVFPFAAGGQGDALARLMAEGLRQPLGRSFIVENRTGAGGRIGVQSVKPAAADGSVLLFVPIAPMSVYPHFYDKLGYDPVADFAPLSQVATFEFALAVHRDVPATTVAELVTWIRASPGRSVYGSPSPGTLPHFFGIEIGRSTGLDLRHVTYRGSAAAVTDLVGGQVPIVITSTSDLVEHHRAGTARILATTDRQRSPFVTGVPTLKEAGIGAEGVGWYAFYAPIHTPPDVIGRLSAAIAGVARSQDVRQRLLALGLSPTGTTPAELAAIQKADFEYWGPIIRRSGYKPDP